MQVGVPVLGHWILYNIFKRVIIMRFHNITKDDMLNGDGLRVVLWVSGCDHNCEDCQNPITWDPNQGVVFDEAAKAEIFDQLNKSYISGITFSGGDPLFLGNRTEITEFSKELREKYPDKTQWMYTGYDYEEVAGLEVMKYIDVLVDGEYKKSLRDVTALWKGSTNQRVIDVKATRDTGAIVLHCEDKE